MSQKNYQYSNDRQSHRGGQSSENRALIEAKMFLENNIGEILRMSKSDQAGKIISELSEFVRHGCEQLKSHQIRNIYEVVKRNREVAAIQAVARPRMVNIAGKQTDPMARQAVELFEKILEAVKEPDEVKECHLFFESIVCYHKYHFGDKVK